MEEEGIVGREHEHEHWIMRCIMTLVCPRHFCFSWGPPPLKSVKNCILWLHRHEYEYNSGWSIYIIYILIYKYMYYTYVCISLGFKRVWIISWAPKSTLALCLLCLMDMWPLLGKVGSIGRQLWVVQLCWILSVVLFLSPCLWSYPLPAHIWANLYHLLFLRPCSPETGLSWVVSPSNSYLFRTSERDYFKIESLQM